MKFGTTASRASTARAFVKYRFEVPSARSSVSESATPFSAVIVRLSDPSFVITMFVFVALARRLAASALARAFV